MTGSKWTNNAKKMVLIVLTMVLGTWCFVPPAEAESVYSYSDQSSGVKAEGKGTYLSGDHMVWYEEDGKGHQNIFYKNIRTDERKQITDYPSKKDEPSVTVTDSGEVVVIWLDKRYVGSGSVMWDVVAQFVDSGEELKLTSTIAPHMSVTASGNYVAWYETWKREMFYYDLSQKKEKHLGTGRQPNVADGKIAFISETGDVALHTIANDTTEVLVELPYHLYPTDITYDGTYILWKETDLDWRTKYVMLNTADSQAKPVDLTTKVYKDVEYPNLYIGDGQAAWVEWNNGVQQLTGASLIHGETHTIAQGEHVLKTMAFKDGQLIMQGADDTLIYRTIIRTEVNSNWSGAVVEQSNVVTGKLGPEGGTLAVKDGSVRLIVPAGALEQETTVTLEPDSSIAAPVSVPHLLGTTWSASLAWKVNVEGEFSEGQHMQLLIAVDRLRWTTEQKQQMSVYRWSEKDENWLRVGGLTQSGENEIAAEITESGTYVVRMNDWSFSDVSGHWAQSNVEILAAKEIVNGLNGKRFAPNEALTRAQFTKMLLGAIGVAPAMEAAGTFKDVPAEHWSAGWVEAAAKLGIVQGNARSFKPDDVLSREEMVVMLMRALGKEQDALAFNDHLTFLDSANVSEWAVGHTALAAEMGLVQGNKGNFRPKASSTRAEAAAVIYRLMDKSETL